MSNPVPRFAVVDMPDAQGGLVDFLRGVRARLRHPTLVLTLLLLVGAQLAFRLAHLGQTTLGENRLIFPDSAWKAVLLMQAVFVASLVLGAIVADEAVARGANRWPTYLGALLIGSAFAAWAQYALNRGLGWVEVQIVLPNGGPAMPPSFRPAQLFFGSLLYGTCGYFVYVNHRTARHAADRMRAAELQRAKSRRRTLESRLQAMQARVEPQFLFNTLAQVSELYERDATIGGRMLDDLIAYLRAALPHLRESSSTLGRELELARAYLDIMRVRLGERLVFEIDVPEIARSARMPPMMLLPLVDHALVYGLQPGDGHGSILIQTVARDGRLCLQVTDSGAGFVTSAGDSGLASIAERLEALYGKDALFELERMRERGTRATLDIPYESTDLRDR